MRTAKSGCATSKQPTTKLIKKISQGTAFCFALRPCLAILLSRYLAPVWDGRGVGVNSFPVQAGIGDWRLPISVSNCHFIDEALYVDMRHGCTAQVQSETDARGRSHCIRRLKKDVELNPGRQVAVIGGSASGFFTASLLARAGCSVEVLERSEQLDHTPRTLIVTSHMRTLLGEVGERAIVNEIRKFELFTDGRTAQVPLDRPDLIIERSRIDSRPCRAGAKDMAQRFRSATGSRRCKAMEMVCAWASNASQSGRPEELHADIVVGADGALSRVAQAAGWPRQPTVPLVQAIVRKCLPICLRTPCASGSFRMTRRTSIG